jgi:hypothetical protein
MNRIHPTTNVFDPSFPSNPPEITKEDLGSLNLDYEEREGERTRETTLNTIGMRKKSNLKILINSN